MTNSMATKKELVLIAYKESYDLDVAMLKADIAPEEQAMLKRDEDFMYSIAFADAEIRQEMIQVLRMGMESPKISVAMQAAKDLGKILWPDKFNGKPTDDGKSGMVPDSITIRGKKPRE